MKYIKESSTYSFPVSKQVVKELKLGHSSNEPIGRVLKTRKTKHGLLVKIPFNQHQPTKWEKIRHALIDNLREEWKWYLVLILVNVLGWLIAHYIVENIFHQSW